MSKSCKHHYRFVKSRNFKEGRQGYKYVVSILRFYCIKYLRLKDINDPGEEIKPNPEE